MKEAKPEDINIYPAGFRITRILTDYICSKISRALVGTAVLAFNRSSGSPPTFIINKLIVQHNNTQIIGPHWHFN